MTQALSTIGWSDKQQNDPEVVALREHLDAHNGMPGLEIFSPADVDAAVQSFHRNGFVLIHSVLNDEQIESMRRDRESGIKIKDLMSRYGLSKASVYRLLAA